MVAHAWGDDVPAEHVMVGSASLLAWQQACTTAMLLLARGRRAYFCKRLPRLEASDAAGPLLQA